MLNLDETLAITADYNIQRDWILKGFFYVGILVTFINFVRAQIPEIKLLQLVPGFYLILLFTAFILLFFFSDLFSPLANNLENRKDIGTKTFEKTKLTLFSNYVFFFISLTILIVITNIFPLGLESFSSYEGKSLENIWSFNEVIGLEYALTCALVIFSQFPPLAVLQTSLELEFLLLPKFWKVINLSIFLGSGIATPTIDGYTQLSFAGSGIVLYLLTISNAGKQTGIRFSGMLTKNG